MPELRDPIQSVNAVLECKREPVSPYRQPLVTGLVIIVAVALDTYNWFVVAVDLLGRAEHGPDPPTVLMTTSERVARSTIDYVDEILVDCGWGST